MTELLTSAFLGGFGLFSSFSKESGGTVCAGFFGEGDALAGGEAAPRSPDVKDSISYTRIGFSALPLTPVLLARSSLSGELVTFASGPYIYNE